MPHPAPQYIVKSGALHHLTTGHTVQMSMNSGCTVFSKRLISKDIGYAGIWSLSSLRSTENKSVKQTHTHTQSHKEPKDAISNHRSGLRCRKKTGGMPRP